MNNPCEKFNCPCDEFVHPPQLKIPPGLAQIPRQIATFPQFRRAMLATIRDKGVLADWRARGQDDLGLMLLEMWAYVSDALAFYDEVIAHETYIRTARRRPSLRKLVDLVGYLPRPAVSAAVRLALLAEGPRSAIVPAGTAFRSGAFDGEAPQVFELNAQTTVDPLTNSWTVEPSRPKILGVENPAHLMLDAATLKFNPGDIVLVQVDNHTDRNQVRKVNNLTPIEGQDGRKYVRLDFDKPLASDASTPLADIKLWTPTQMVSLWTLPRIGSNPDAIENPDGQNTRLTLDGIYRQIKPEMYVLVAGKGDHRWFQVSQVREARMEVSAAVPFKVGDKSITLPGAAATVTRLVLDTFLNDDKRMSDGDEKWNNDHRAEITVHYGFIEGGVVTAERNITLTPRNLLKLIGPIEAPRDGQSPSRFLLVDKDERGVEVSGRISFTEQTLTLNEGTTWEPALVHPVQVYGNVIAAGRGETVATAEVLGSGEASVGNQTFGLKKKPLTYVAAPTQDKVHGIAGTLNVFVNGILWQEVPTFFGAGPDDRVYIVRQNDEGESRVIFGDGRRGARLPSGTDNVVAIYRFGAGAASPPSGSITQIAKPVKGVNSVKNPVAAAGGGDAESSENLRTLAPKSALILGRAVSIQDMQAVAAGVAGVRAVCTEWQWHTTRQRPVVQVWYIGEPGIEETVSQTIRGLSDPSLAINVTPAQGLPAVLAVDLEIDSRHIGEDVLFAVRSALLDPPTGLLTPERIGIGRILYRSRIFETVLAVPGTVAVRGILWNGVPLASFAISPGAGRYFDLEKGSLVLNGHE